MDPHKASYEQIYQTIGLRDEPHFYRRIARLIKTQPGERLLDIACGDGSLLEAVAQRQPAAELFGLDISEQALAQAGLRCPAAHLTIGNGESLPFPAAFFDRITCLGSLENFETPVQALAEIRRVLKEDGSLCVMMPNKYWLGDILQVATGRDESIPFQHVERTATLVQWRGLLQQAGFLVQNVQGYIKRAPLIKQGKLRSIPKFLATHLLAAISSPPLAWSIIFLCRKAQQAAATDGIPWTWRVEWLHPH